MDRQPDLDQRARWVAFIQAMHPGIDPRSIRLMDDMRRVAHLLYQIGESSVEEVGLSYAQYRILMALLYDESTGSTQGLNPSAISDRQGTSRNTVSALIRSLEDEGLVERHLNREDRRRFNIRLTDKGRRLVRENAGHHMQTVCEIFSVLDEEESETLSNLLRRLSHQAADVREKGVSGMGGSHAASK